MPLGVQKNRQILRVQTEEVVTMGFLSKSGIYLDLEERPLTYILGKHLATFSPTS